MTIDEDAILLRAKTGEEQFAPFFDGHVMLFVDADHQLVSLCQFQRCKAKVFDSGLAVDLDFEIPDNLIEREIDLVRLVNTHSEAELHVRLLHARIGFDDERLRLAFAVNS